MEEADVFNVGRCSRPKEKHRLFGYLLVCKDVAPQLNKTDKAWGIRCARAITAFKLIGSYSLHCFFAEPGSEIPISKQAV